MLKSPIKHKLKISKDKIDYKLGEEFNKIMKLLFKDSYLAVSFHVYLGTSVEWELDLAVNRDDQWKQECPLPFLVQL